MKRIQEIELESIIGGAISITTLLNSLTKVVNSVLTVGRSLGSAIRRITSNDMCRCK